MVETNPMTDNYLWTQRVEKELARVAKGGRNTFSLHGAVTDFTRLGLAKECVPMKFKPGHLGIDDFKASRAAQGFVPEKYGWDPNGPEMATFKKSMHLLKSEPQFTASVPETESQEMGWMLAKQRGHASERIRRSRMPRLGIGWVDDPARVSSVAPAPPVEAIAPPTAPRSPSTLSANPPAASSQLSACGPSRTQSQLSASRGGKAGHDAGTSLSAAAPSQLSAVGSQLSRATSLPSELMRKDPSTWLQGRERKCGNVLNELGRYGPTGERGHKHSHPVGETDVTKFHTFFTKCTGGVSLFEYGKDLSGVFLKDPRTRNPCPTWK